MIREWNEESLDHRNALLYAMGISEEDAKRPVIGLVNSWNEMNPGHFPFDKTVIQEMKDEIYKAGGLALELPVTGICDGICSNTPGDRYTLPARDLVSSEVEMVAELNMLEGMVIMATCDKVVPGMLMGAFRVNIPTTMLTGGYMAAGCYEDRMLTLTHTKQAYAAYVEGDMSREEYKAIVRHACPTPGACPFMGTANTMCAMAEILGFSPHGNASVRSQSEKWHQMAREAARKVVEAVKEEKRPSDFVTQKSLENVVRYMMATGGSTNSLLHIPALARQMGFDITPETFDAISREVPLISTIYPNHPVYTMEEFDRAGGLGAVVKEMVKAGKIDADADGMFGTIRQKAELAENADGQPQADGGILRAVLHDDGLSSGLDFKKGPGEQHADQGEDHKAAKGQKDARIGGPVRHGLILLAQGAGEKGVDAHGGARAHGNHQVLQGERQGDGVQGILAELGHEDAVHHVIKCLYQH